MNEQTPQESGAVDDGMERLDELNRRLDWSERLGGADAVAREHQRGRLTVRERIERLVDADSFREVGRLAGRGDYIDGQIRHVVPASYVAGLAKINGRSVAVGGEDFTVRGGTNTSAGRRKGGQGGFIEDLAHHYRVPLINLCQGGGGSVTALARKGHAPLPGEDGLERSIDLLGTVPVVGALMGPSAGGPALRAIFSHFSLMPRNTAQIMIAGPRVVTRAIGEELSAEELGGAAVAVDQAGTIDNAYDSEPECLDAIRSFLSYLPQNVWELPPLGPRLDPQNRLTPELRDIVPARRTKPYNMHKLVDLVMDRDSLFEIQPTYGKPVICLLARLNGVPVGVVAHNPMVNGGSVNVAAARKQRHFVDLCNTFHLPLIYFVDTPGFMVGSRAESEAMMREGLRCLQACAEVSVPVLTLIIRKCYGAAGMMTQHKNGIDLKVAWPSGEWGSLPLEGGIAVAFGREIQTAPDPVVRERELEETVKMLTSPFRTAEAFGIEDIIDPAATRPYLSAFIDVARESMRHSTGPKALVGVRP